MYGMNLWSLSISGNNAKGVWSDVEWENPYLADQIAQDQKMKHMALSQHIKDKILAFRAMPRLDYNVHWNFKLYLGLDDLQWFPL